MELKVRGSDGIACVDRIGQGSNTTIAYSASLKHVISFENHVQRTKKLRTRVCDFKNIAFCVKKNKFSAINGPSLTLWSKAFD